VKIAIAPTSGIALPLASGEGDERRAPDRTPSVDDVGRKLLQVIHDSNGFTMATWKNVALHVWTAQATPATVDTLDELSARFASAHPEGLSAVHIITNNIPPPDSHVREQLRQVTNRYAEQIACVCHVVEGSGFWASALHSFLTGLHFLTRGPFKMHICSDIPAASRWVPAQHVRRTKVAIAPAELEDVLKYVRQRAIEATP
jgi:hypothetical protein